MSIESDIRYLLDRLEIQDVIQRYGVGQDDHQGGADNDVLAEWIDVFTPDATVDYSASGHAGPSASYRELARQMRGRNLAGDGSMRVLASWQHFEGVPTVVIDGDVARARTPHLHTHQGRCEGPEGWNVMEAGVFVDDLVRTPDGWRITHRRLEVHYVDTLVTNGALYKRAT
jgi:SnoaL-like domain